MADAYAVLGFYDYLRPVEAFPKAEVAARRAILLDDEYATRHQWYGNLLTAAGRFPDAVREMGGPEASIRGR